MPNLTVRLDRSGSIDPCSTHGRVLSASRTCPGQVAQVMPGSFSSTVAMTALGGRTGVGASATGGGDALGRAAAPPQPTTAAASTAAAAPLARTRIAWSPRLGGRGPRRQGRPPPHILPRRGTVVDRELPEQERVDVR